MRLITYESYSFEEKAPDLHEYIVVLLNGVYYDQGSFQNDFTGFVLMQDDGERHRHIYPMDNRYYTWYSLEKPQVN